jgi:membrane protein
MGSGPTLKPGKSWGGRPARHFGGQCPSYTNLSELKHLMPPSPSGMNQIALRLRECAQQVWVLLRDTFAKWSNDKASQLGAALAFYTIFSLAPILIIIVAIVGFILGKHSVNTYLLGELAKFVGQSNAEFVMSTIQSSYQAGSGLRATIIAISLILVGATTVCVTLKDALNTMWGVENSSSGLWQMIKNRFLALIFILIVGAFLFLSMIISSALSTMSVYLSNYADIPLNLIGWLNSIFSIILLSLLFALLYKVLPDVDISWGDIWMGGAITALLFTLGRFLVGLYLERSTISSAYGAAGSLVVMLLWVYYSALIIFFGAEFTQVYARMYGSEITPKKPRS